MVKHSVNHMEGNVQLLANLIYLAGHTETHSAQQQEYLDWAEKVLSDVEHHLKRHE
jgi:hypothetical protein